MRNVEVIFAAALYETCVCPVHDLAFDATMLAGGVPGTGR